MKSCDLFWPIHSIESENPNLPTSRQGFSTDGCKMPRKPWELLWSLFLTVLGASFVFVSFWTGGCKNAELLTTIPRGCEGCCSSMLSKHVPEPNISPFCWAEAAPLIPRKYPLYCPHVATGQPLLEVQQVVQKAGARFFPFSCGYPAGWKGPDAVANLASKEVPGVPVGDPSASLLVALEFWWSLPMYRCTRTSFSLPHPLA